MILWFYIFITLLWYYLASERLFLQINHRLCPLFLLLHLSPWLKYSNGRFRTIFKGIMILDKGSHQKKCGIIQPKPTHPTRLVRKKNNMVYKLFLSINEQLKKIYFFPLKKSKILKYLKISISGRSSSHLDLRIF